jgi:predicted HicB family RNase H-like nuclease
MKEFIIRNIPDELHKAIKQAALDANQPMNTLIINIITKAIDKPKTKKEEGR